MKEIKLINKKHPNKVALIDDEDFEFLNKFKWYARESNYTFYAERNKMKINKIIGSTKMHRLIMNTNDPKIIIDHKDRNGLNCQKSNLRICSVTQNNANKKSEKNSTSNYLGVNWKKLNNKWVAQIAKNGKKSHIGLFKTEEDAARAYDAAAKIHHGEFANLNFKD